MKLKRSTLIPLILLVYLGVMAYIGYPGYVSGATSALHYYGVIVTTLGIIVALHFSIKRRERLRRERMSEMERTENEQENKTTL